MHFNLQFLKILLIGILLFFHHQVHSQFFDEKIDLSDSTQIHILKLKDGTRMRGRITKIEDNDFYFFIKKKKKDSLFQLAQIQKIKLRNNLFNFEEGSQDSTTSTSLFVTNTAFSIPNGVTQYRTFFGASMLYDLGLGNGISIGTGFSFPLLFSVNLKFTGPIKNGGRFAYKSTYLTFPFGFAIEERFGIWENAVILTYGPKNRFFNASLSHYLIQDDGSFFETNDVPRSYLALAYGGAFPIHHNLQIILEHTTHFNGTFLSTNFLPSFGVNWTVGEDSQIIIGFKSIRELGFNFFPVTDSTEDGAVSFRPGFFARMPFFSYSKLF